MPERIHLSPGQPWRTAGAAGARTVVVDLGPEHPSRTGLLDVEATLDNGVLREVTIGPGANHRSVEKLFEVRDYRQVLVLADRHDWQAPFTGELVVALACEHLMGLVPPERATWLRTVLAEHARISSHLAHLSFVAHHEHDDGLAARIRHDREAGRALLLAATGNRIHPMVNRLGGLALDVNAGRLGQFTRWAHECARTATNVAQVLAHSGLGRGVATCDAARCDAYGLGGPAAIAAGIDDDLRSSGNYLAYGSVSGQFPLVVEGIAPDAAGRLTVLCAQVGQSARIIESLVEGLATIGGPVDTKLSKMVKIPDSEGYVEVEAPWGRAGALVVSRAERTPWRLALRTPSFANVQALEAVLDGVALADVAVAMASLGWTTGDLDK